MKTVKNDVEKFNLYAENLITQLAAQGAVSNKLLTNLFNVCQEVNDQPFVRHIEGKENAFDEGEQITPQQLMRVALQKYKTRVDNGTWESSTAEEERIMALEAELVQLQRRTNRSTNNRRGGNNTSNSSNSNQTNTTNNSSNNGNNNDNNNRRNKRKPRKPKPDWTKTPPTEAEKAAGSKKQVDNKWWWWCPKHNEWCRHKPEDCKGVNLPNANRAQAQPAAQTQAAATLIAPYSTDEDEDSE